MTQDDTQQRGFSLGADDILFILNRQKWKIIFFSILGITAAAYIFFAQEPLYSARAKLMIRYVAETQMSDPDAPPSSEVIRSPEARGSTVIASEIEILTSLDTLTAAASRVGPPLVLRPFGGGTNAMHAGAVLRKHLTVEPSKNSGVITITQEHRDPQIALNALRATIDEYLRKHLEVHSAAKAYDMLQSQVDQLRARLKLTEDQLRDEKNSAGIISLEQSKLEVSTQLATFRSAIFSAEAELAERAAELAQIPQAGVRVDEAGQNGPEMKSVAAQADLPDEEILRAYHVFLNKLRRLKAQELEWMTHYKDESKAITTLRRQIAETQQALDSLGVDPAMVQGAEVPTEKQPSAPSLNGNDSRTARVRIAALEARINRLKTQMQEVRNQSKLLDSYENNILQLQRKKELDEQKLRYSEAKLERARFDQAIDTSKLNNITTIQEPAPAGRDMSAVFKLIGMILACSVGTGLLMAFVIELGLDRSLKRPKEVEQALGIPVVASIPMIKFTRRKLKRKASELSQLTLAQSDASWDESDPMLAYYEALRDRIVMSYEGDLHKPKIVGVTSCNNGSGTTRIATGLAAALSRDVERKVLFIALEKGKVSVTSFFKGRPSAQFPDSNGLQDGGDEGFVAQNLQSLTHRGCNIAGASAVQSFTELLPKLESCDYDFIIFDLPPISQTNGSLRLVSQMERTLVVCEAEKTSKDIAKTRVRDLDVKPGKFYAVFNKVPRILSDAS
jgi:polysaccharide biosynthesis transport protein